MKSNHFFHLLIVACLLGTSLFCSVDSHAQLVKHESLLSFEGKSPNKMWQTNHSNIAISKRHFKDGQQSLCWKFQPNGTLTLDKDLKFEPKDPTGKDTFLSTFVVWIYNEKAIDDVARFQFLKNKKVCNYFDCRLNFTGWRGIWVDYERDMEGKAQEGMNQMRIIAPKTSGKLYLDQMITAIKTDARQQTPDLQVPFVNKETKEHWLLIYKHSFYKPDIALRPLTNNDKEAIKTISTRFEESIYHPNKLKKSTLQSIRQAYNNYHITYKNGIVTGRPLFHCRQSECFQRMLGKEWDKNMMEHQGIDLKTYFKWMYSAAEAYKNTELTDAKDELKNIFLNMYRHQVDQGVSYGSCFGNIHHYGYSFRHYYKALFLMKKVLKDTGYLQDAEKAMRWYAITNEVYPIPTKAGISMDAFNTQTEGRIASILMMEDSPEKVQYLRSFSRWIQWGCYPANGLEDSFKLDGSAYHHCNNYPAYAVGGLDGATNMIYLLSHTSYAVDSLATETVNNVLLKMRFYCNKLNFPLAMSGRHPDGRGKITPNFYARMALVGSPNQKQKIDSRIAKAFLRLVKTPNTKEGKPEWEPKRATGFEKKVITILHQAGFKAEPTPTGNLSLPYACSSVQREQNWSAVVRGHSRYLWAAEHYLGANLFGRYLAHGSMQIMTAPDGITVTPITSGWQEAGFDWGRIPGTTAIHLPIKELHARIYNVDTFSGVEEMLYSDEAFAGGLSFRETNGNFGMKLHEHDKYNGSHKARKSWHFFANEIVCLGSDIENVENNHPTETTIFQLAIFNKKQKANAEALQIKGNTLVDIYGTGYYFPDNEVSKLKLNNNFPQYSLNEETTKPTKGNWTSLVINHGKAPKNESYEYAVLPNVSSARMQKLSKHVDYTIIKKDRDAHIVQKENMMSYVLFEPLKNFTKGLIINTNNSCLIMTNELKNSVQLSIANPDLALYTGPADVLLDKDGKRTERSIYSRPWIHNESKIIPIQITLEGSWELKQSVKNVELISRTKEQTIVEIKTQHGLSSDLTLIAY